MSEDVEALHLAAEPEALTRKALVGTGWSGMATAARQVLSFAAVAVLARKLGPDAYGLMGMAALLTNFLLNFKDLGTATAIIQRPAISQKLLSSVFWLNLALGATLSIAVIALAIPAAHFFREPELAPIMWVLSTSFSITASGLVQNAVLTRAMRFDRLAMTDFASAVAGYAIAIPCAYAGLGVWSLVLANIMNAITTTTLYWILCPWRPSREFDRASVRSIAGFSLNLSGFGVVNYFARNADNLVIGRVLGSAPLGLYQMAYNLMLFPIQNISAVIAQVLFPGFARIQDDDARFRSAYTRSCMLIGLITFPVIAGLAVIANPLVRTLLGPKWLPVIPLFQILAPVGLIQSIQTTIGQIFTAKARTDWMFRWGMVQTACLVLSFLIGVHWGVMGVATAYAITYAVAIAYPGFAIPFRLIGLRFRDFAAALLPQIGITAAMVAGCIALLHFIPAIPAAAQLAASVSLGAAIYVGLMLWLRPPVVGHFVEVAGHLRYPGIAKWLRRLCRQA